MTECVGLLAYLEGIELIWASPRELLNIFQADAIGCEIITVTPDLLKKLDLVGKDLDEFSLETVQMFYRDATMAGFDPIAFEAALESALPAGAEIGGARRVFTAVDSTNDEAAAWARELAPVMLDQHPAFAAQHVLRWLGGKAEFLKA